MAWWEMVELSVMVSAFLICFLAGLVLLLLDIFAGSLSGVLNLDVDLDVDVDADALGAAGSWLPLRPMSVLAGITIFGGVGTLMSVVFRLDWPQGLVALLAAAIGVLAAILVERLVVRPLKTNRADATKAQQLVGQSAEVTVRIRPGAIGEVSIKNERGILNYRAKWYDEAETEVAEAGTYVGVMALSQDLDTVYVVPLDLDKWVKRFKS